MSLIPQPPCAGGRVAMQSASSGGEIVQCWADYEVVNEQTDCFEYIGEFCRCLFVSSRHPDKREKKEFTTYNGCHTGKEKVV